MRLKVRLKEPYFASKGILICRDRDLFSEVVSKYHFYVWILLVRVQMMLIESMILMVVHPSTKCS